VKMGSPEGYITVASVHSHCSFSAFHSGTDIADEEYIEGLHITIGDVDEDHFSLVASIVSNRKRFKVDPLDFISGIDEYEGAGNSKLKYLIAGGYVESYDPEWLKFITGTKYEPYQGTGFLWGGRYPISTIEDIKNYQQYFKERKQERIITEKANDPCNVCPFRKEKEPEITVADLFFEGY